jgi:DNA-3-methyladenine glycosylase
VKSKKLEPGFYLRKNVLQITQELIGKFLVTNFGNTITSGMIVEAESYNGVIDKASHAYNNRRTKRNEVMYSEGGRGYVYLCYGIHHLFNVVTNKKDIPHAILIRAVIPKDGIDTILKRRKQKTITKKTSDGPGTLSTALGIKTSHSGVSLSENLIWIEDRGIKFSKKDIIKSPRIGVDYAGEDSKLPYRYRLKEEIILHFLKKRDVK